MFVTESQLQLVRQEQCEASETAGYVSPQAHLPFLLAGGLEDFRRRIVVYPVLGHTTKHLVRSFTHEWSDKLVLAAMWLQPTPLTLAESREDGRAASALNPTHTRPRPQYASIPIQTL